MTGAIAAGQYYIAAAVPITVQLHDQTVFDAVAGTATVSYAINSNRNADATPDGTLESWLTGTGANAANYEVKATQTSGAAVTGTLGSWLNCGTDRSWTITNSARNNSVKTGVIAVQIRDVATSTVLASASITLSAESDG